MYENFIYEDHSGRRFSGLERGVFLNANDLRDYSWKYDAVGGRITRFYRDITRRILPLVFVGKTAEESAATRHELLEYTESDIEAQLPGKIWVGEYYTQGYVTGSSKSRYMIDKRWCRIDLTLTSDDANWYWEQTSVFSPDSGGEEESAGGIDYPYDYSYDYSASSGGQNVINSAATDSAFRMTIYGPVTDPYVTINGHRYEVQGTVYESERLTIDSLTKTITLTDAQGRKYNWFDRRGRTDYIFQPIPPGVSSVDWIDSFGFDLTLIERRSEPKWI